MQGRLSTLIEKFRSQPMSDETRERLQRQMDQADSVLVLVEQKEFQDHQERLRSLVKEEQTKLLGMGIEEFAGVKGAEQRGFIRGIQHAINQPRLIVDAGVQADMQLQAASKPRRKGRLAESLS